MNAILKAKKTQVEMVHDRGFQLPPEEQFVLSMDVAALASKSNDIVAAREFKKQVKKLKKLDLNQRYVKRGDDNTTLIVHYCVEDKLINSVKQFVKQMATNTHGIIISNEDDFKKLSQKQYQDELSKIQLKECQVFTFDELSFNVLKHVYQSTFEQVQPSLIIPSIANASQLPMFLKNDPIVRYYNWPVGSVIKVTDTLYLDTLVDQRIDFMIVSNHVKIYK